LSLPVLAVPFWGRPQSLPKAPTRKAASIENQQLPRIAPVRDGMNLTLTPSRNVGHSGTAGEISMYAVIRTGGKQYRVAPGDVIRVERVDSENHGTGTDGKIEFRDVLAVSAGDGQIGKPQSAALVTGEVVEQGREKKILVFHYKRKKQYKKLRGHRQGYTAVRITEISYDGQKFAAPEQSRKVAKPKKAAPPETGEVKAAGAKAHKAPAKKKTAGKKSAPKKAAPKKKK
jgi:large subunit ribosomal protein L21